MNGVHDMGGMHGFGPIRAEVNEPVFHARWEARVFALSSLMGAWRRWNLDAFRYSIERLPPTDYLRMSYYEKWLASLVVRSIDAGLVTPEEVSSGRMTVGSAPQSPPMTADELPAVLAAGDSTQRTIVTNPRFAPGAVVRVKNVHPTGHTRLPRYVRGRLGVIERDHGAHVFPDSNALYRGENPQTVYTVRFAARELWGDAENPADAIYLDLWDDYLDPQ
jgi:nitrile hydratase beta subunit